MRTAKSRLAIGAALLAAPLMLTGCLASSSGGSAGSTTGANSNTKSTINFTVAFSGAQYDNFRAAVDPWAKSQGITINWASDSNFNADIVNKVKAGQAPDIAMFPQPGILLDFAKQGKVVPMESYLDVNSVTSGMVSNIGDAGTYDGKIYGLPPSINVKSLVFYPKKAWAAAGLKAPETLDDLLSFSQQLKTSGKTPWCMGIESGTATGWPATDWMEQLVLDYGGTDTYNKWVNHDVKFDSDTVKQAGEYFQKIFGTQGFVQGGQSSIASTNFGTAGNGMFDANNTESNPSCWMYKQGNFITQSGFFPDAILKNLDENVGVFQFPGTSASDKPVEIGGDLAALFSGNNDSAKKVMKYLLTKDFCTSCAKAGGYISPFKDFDTSNYPNELTKQMAQIAYDSNASGFDGSDRMPGAVGSGSFWREMTAWISGTQDLDTTLKNIDNSWPTS